MLLAVVVVVPGENLFNESSRQKKEREREGEIEKRRRRRMGGADNKGVGSGYAMSWSNEGGACFLLVRQVFRSCTS